MDKKTEYLKQELIEYRKMQHDVEVNIHNVKLSIESTSNAINQIKQSNDDTELPFYTSDKIPGFCGQEIDKLNQENEYLNKQLEDFHNQKNLIDTKIFKLNDLLNNRCDDNYKDPLEVLNVQEIERQRIARDIHDTVVQNISALIYKNEFVLNIIDTDANRAKLELSVNNNILKNCINELRSIIFNLRPMSLNDLDIKSSLNNIISHIQDSTEMIIDYRLSHDGTEVKSVILISIVRIIQELCNNSIKHSKGTTIKIDININHKCCNINYEDDGVGYHIEDLTSYKKDNTGFGLSIMKDRIELLGGTICFDNNRKKGIHYNITIPICEENNKCQ